MKNYSHISAIKVSFVDETASSFIKNQQKTCFFCLNSNLV